MMLTSFIQSLRSAPPKTSNFLTETRAEIQGIIDGVHADSHEVPAHCWEVRAFSDQIIDFLPVMVLVKDVNTKRYVRVNKTAQQYFGLSETDFVEKTAQDVMSREAAAEDSLADAACIASNEPCFNAEVSMTIHEQKFWFKTNRTVLRDYAGKNKYIIVIYDDITANKIVADELLEAKQFIENLISSIPIPVFWKDKNHRYIGCNVPFSSLIGMSPEQISGKTIWEIFPDDFANGLCKTDDVCLVERKTNTYQDKIYSMQHHNIRDMVYHNSPIFAAGGDVIGMIGVALDITEIQENKKINDVLLEALENSSDAIILTNEFNRIIYVNKEFERMHGYARHEILGHKPSIFSSGTHDGEYFKEMWLSLRGGKPWNNKIIDKNKSGGLIENEMTIIPIMNGKPEPIYYLGIKHKVGKREITPSQSSIPGGS